MAPREGIADRDADGRVSALERRDQHEVVDVITTTADGTTTTRGGAILEASEAYDQSARTDSALVADADVPGRDTESTPTRSNRSTSEHADTGSQEIGIPSTYTDMAPRLTANQRRGNVSSNEALINRYKKKMLAREPHLVEMFPPKNMPSTSRVELCEDTLGDDTLPMDEEEWVDMDAYHIHRAEVNRPLGESKKASWPRTIKEAMSRDDHVLWREAIIKEAKSVLSNGTIKDARWVRGVSTKPLPLMWVLTIKHKEDGSID
jgi:hypothetical protein